MSFSADEEMRFQGSCKGARGIVDSVDRRSSAGKLFQVSGPETTKFLRPMAVAVRCTPSLLEAPDRTCRRPVCVYVLVRVDVGQIV